MSKYFPVSVKKTSDIGTQTDSMSIEPRNLGLKVAFSIIMLMLVFVFLGVFAGLH